MNNYRKAKKIEKLRHLREKPQKWMAQELGIAQSTYSEWESGDVEINEERTEQIAKLLQTTSDWLNNPDDVEVVMNNNHGNGNNGYVVVQNQQQHLVPQEMFKQITDQLAQVIKDQSELLKETQKDRSRMMDLLDYWTKQQKSKK